MASIESKWDLRCDSSPRSIAVGVAPSVRASSAQSQSTGSTSITGQPSSYSNASRQATNHALQSRLSSSSAISPSTNPFDAVFDGTTKMSSMTSARGPKNTNPFLYTASSSSSSRAQDQKRLESTTLSSGYALIIGTERGTIHYRTFPNVESQDHHRDVSFTSSDSVVQPKGLDGTSSDRVHPLHRPLDSNISVNKDVQNHSPIVACVCASFSGDCGVRSGNFSDSNGSPETFSATDSSSIYLLLQHDKHRISNSKTKIESNKSREMPSADDDGAYAANLISIHKITNSVATVYPSHQLPRMSCATYHPSCGYVYAAGTSICSLPHGAVRAIASACKENITSNPSDEVIGSTSTSARLEPATNGNRLSVYYNATRILPSAARSGIDSISPACDGRVMIVAVGNAFYAVSSSPAPHGTWENEKVPSTDQHTLESGSGSAVRQGLDYRSGFDEDDVPLEDGADVNKGADIERVLKFRLSSQVHPAIVVDVPMGLDTRHESQQLSALEIAEIPMGDEAFTSLLFLASGRECAVVEILYNPRLYSNSGHKRPDNIDEPENRMLLPSPSISCGSIIVGAPRRGIVTIASPILAAVGIQSTSRRTGPLLALLTSDGLVHTRSPSCIAIPLSTIEVGTRPNDFFSLRSLPNKEIVAISHGGEGRLISFREETVQDIADRMMKLSIDAFGSEKKSFPRSKLAEAIEAKFSATSYVGPEPTNSAKTILRQYLEMILGLDIHGDFAGGDATSWFFEDNKEDGQHANANYKAVRLVSRSPYASTYIAATAVLCLLCTHLIPYNPSLANRAAKSCASKLGVVSSLNSSDISTASIQLCKNIVQELLAFAESMHDSDGNITPKRSTGSAKMEIIEAANWLLRSCGEHEHAIKIYRNIMSNADVSNASSETVVPESSTATTPGRRSDWSQLKCESFMATHLGDLWSHGDDSCRELVLTSSATRQVLESNPMLGIGIFTASHPSNGEEWTAKSSEQVHSDFPQFSMKVVEVLKSIRPFIPHDKLHNITQRDKSLHGRHEKNAVLPLESGKALAATYLESLIGISSQRPPTKYTAKPSNESNGTKMQNELALLLLEGVLSERSDDQADGDSHLGMIYRSKLRRLLGWYNASVTPEILMTALPSSFLRERALLLGQLGRHEDALRIFYCQLGSLDLALEYCDARFEKQQVHHRSEFHKRFINGDRNSPLDMNCPYLPLVAVALATDDSECGISAAVRVLSLRRENIDRTAALQLLPKHIPISVLSKCFLIPALIDSASEARRMTVVSSLLKAKYVRLKHSLTNSQIKSQSSIHTVPGLKSLNLGDPIYSSKAFKARPSSSAISYFPDIYITKYFYPRYVVIQTTVTNSGGSLDMQTLGDVQLIVAESSDDALIPTMNIAIKNLPPKITGSAWCVLAASSQRLEGIATLTCELRYKLLDVDNATGTSLNFSSDFEMTNRSFVEEIQDIEIRRAEFEG